MSEHVEGCPKVSGYSEWCQCDELLAMARAEDHEPGCAAPHGGCCDCERHGRAALRAERDRYLAALRAIDAAETWSEVIKIHQPLLESNGRVVCTGCGRAVDHEMLRVALSAERQLAQEHAATIRELVVAGQRVQAERDRLRDALRDMLAGEPCKCDACRRARELLAELREPAGGGEE